MEIGVNQKRELEEERKRIEKLLKGADLLLGSDIPAVAVELGTGQCTKSKITAACNKKGLTPVCDHTTYARYGACWTPGKQNGSPFFNRHFSHWASHRQHMGIANFDDAKFYGMCFWAHGNGDWALAPYRNSHFWTNGNNRLEPWMGGSPSAPRNINPTAGEVNSCKKKEAGGVGCWRTLCVPNKPNGR
jgi:hypothetical protein